MSVDAISSINRKIKETKNEIESLTSCSNELSEIAKFMLEEMNRRLEKLEVEKENIIV